MAKVDEYESKVEFFEQNWVINQYKCFNDVNVLLYQCALML